MEALTVWLSRIYPNHNVGRFVGWGVSGRVLIIRLPFERGLFLRIPRLLWRKP